MLRGVRLCVDKLPGGQRTIAHALNMNNTVTLLGMQAIHVRL